jgi:hypothetical protein
MQYDAPTRPIGRLPPQLADMCGSAMWARIILTMSTRPSPIA